MVSHLMQNNGDAACLGINVLLEPMQHSLVAAFHFIANRIFLARLEILVGDTIRDSL